MIAFRCVPLSEKEHLYSHFPLKTLGDNTGELCKHRLVSLVLLVRFENKIHRQNRCDKFYSDLGEFTPNFLLPRKNIFGVAFLMVNLGVNMEVHGVN